MKYDESYAHVKTCHVCGKAALYHYANVGACKRHVEEVRAIATKSIVRKLHLTSRKKKA